MCPICGKYRELTRCVRRMRIAHPTPPRGGDICPIGTTFLGFGPTPPHGEDIPHAYPTPEAAENFRPGRRRPAESKRGRPRLRPSRRRERPALDGVLSAMSIHRPRPTSGLGRPSCSRRAGRTSCPLAANRPPRRRRTRAAPAPATALPCQRPSPANAAVVRDNIVGTTALSGAEGTDGGRHNNVVSRWIHSPA